MAVQSTLCLAAQELASIQARYASKGMSLSQAALCGAQDFVEWRHYPKHDSVDGNSGYEFYYHAHASHEMPEGEHGHFHLFKRDPKTPGQFFHLIGIALDQKGLPVRLFTTNQWVTGETLLEVEEVIAAVGKFDMAAKGRLAPLARWLTAFTKLFYAEIANLLEARDRKIAELAPRIGSRKALFENHKYQVLTEREINLMNRLSEHLCVAH